MIETKRLRIHMASQDEMECVIEGEADGILKKAYQEMLQGCLDHPEQWKWYAIWIIEDKEGACVGNLSFKGLNTDGSVEIGYGISEAFCGKGYATEAVNAVVDWAMGQPGIARIEAETDPDNMASQRVLEKCGFIPSGVIGEEGPRFIKAN